LEITEDIPSLELLDRWLGEPVRAAIFPTSIFLSNKAGFPTLSRKHQQFVLKLFRVTYYPFVHLKNLTFSTIFDLSFRGILSIKME
jgi:hypothetical protein